MALILHIETSSTLCSVALADSGVFIDQIISEKENDHAALLAVIVAELLRKQQIVINELNAIAVSAGPGSYTGLRIGASLAKGICHASKIPLIAINSLQIMAAGMLTQNKQTDSLLAPLIDARRMEVYTAVFNTNLQFIREPEAVIMESNDFELLLTKNKILFFGSGLEKVKNILQHSNSLFIENFLIHATAMILPVWKQYQAGNFSNIVSFEPSYLKTFSGIARTSANLK